MKKRTKIKKKSLLSRPKPQFPTWPDETCGHCGFKVPPDDPDQYLHRLECPGCYREGCDECMPAGRGCFCPECEEAQ